MDAHGSPEVGQAAWSRQFDVPDERGELTTVAHVIYGDCWKKSVDLEARYAERDHPNRLDARDLILTAMSTQLATPTRAHYQERLSLIDRALSLDPDNFTGLERQARLHAENVLYGFSSDPAADLAIASRAADRALAINANSLISLRAKATVLHAEGNWTAAEAVLRRPPGDLPGVTTRSGHTMCISPSPTWHSASLPTPSRRPGWRSGKCRPTSAG
jgi:hypothetical protein